MIRPKGSKPLGIRMSAAEWRKHVAEEALKSPYVPDDDPDAASGPLDSSFGGDEIDAAEAIEEIHAGRDR